jgi:tryptophan-rich sensory protein
MDWQLFPVFLAACFAAGWTGQMFPPGDWYEGLRKPSWNPPNWLFPIAWTLLYLAIAVAAARIGIHPGNDLALAFWTLQIVLNAIWTPAFFGLQRMGMALAILGALWVAVAATTLAFIRIDPVAGGLFLPYLAWVSFAGVLNFTIWRLNPDRSAA